MLLRTVGKRIPVSFGTTVMRPYHSTMRFNHAGCNGHDSCNHEDTVVTRCTQKISDLLKPVKVTVTSSNDDPNGSHVSLLSAHIYTC